MIYLDLIINLALLVSISLVSGFIDKRWPRSTRIGVLLQGALFGGAAMIGMLRPLDMGAGLIFDGRSVMISLCALFFGPWAAAVTVLMTIPLRIALGGAGMIMGVSVILSSAVIGISAHFRLLQSTEEPPSTRNLYLFGLVVHLVMVALMITLPGNIIISTIKRIGIPVILIYPLATILAGKILSDQVSAIQHIDILKKSEEKFKSIFEASNVGKSITLPSGEINVNQAFCDMLGYTHEELKGKKWQDFTPVNDIQATQNFLNLLLQGSKDSIRFNKRYIHKNGSYIWGDVSVVMQRDTNRHPLFFITTIMDITEHKRADAQLKESEVQYRNLADTGLALIWTAGTDKLCNYFNKPWLKFTGRTLEREIGNGWTEGVHPDDLDRCVQIYVAAFDKREAFDMEYRLRHVSGEYRWIRDLGTPNYNVSGEFIGYIGHCFDINSQKHAEEEIRDLNETLEQRIKERTAALRENIDLLEETNKAFVGRELRMIELKERIAELEKQKT